MEVTAAEDPPEVEPQPDASLDAAQPERSVQAIVVNNPGRAGVGPVMKVKHFRIHAVTDQTILFNWALIYAPDGIGVPQIHPPGQYSQIAEPQQFVIASGTYLASPSSAGAVSP